MGAVGTGNRRDFLHIAVATPERSAQVSTGHWYEKNFPCDLKRLRDLITMPSQQLARAAGWTSDGMKIASPAPTNQPRHSARGDKLWEISREHRVHPGLMARSAAPTAPPADRAATRNNTYMYFGGASYSNTQQGGAGGAGGNGYSYVATVGGNAGAGGAGGEAYGGVYVSYSTTGVVRSYAAAVGGAGGTAGTPGNGTPTGGAGASGGAGGAAGTYAKSYNASGAHGRWPTRPAGPAAPATASTPLWSPAAPAARSAARRPPPMQRPG